MGRREDDGGENSSQDIIDCLLLQQQYHVRMQSMLMVFDVAKDQFNVSEMD